METRRITDQEAKTLFDHLNRLDDRLRSVEALLASVQRYHQAEISAMVRAHTSRSEVQSVLKQYVDRAMAK